MWNAMCVVLAALASSFAFLFVLNFAYKRMCHRKSLAGSVVLVTGAAKGLGRSLALAFARERCHVVCVDLDTERNEQLAKELRALNNGDYRALAFTCDISDLASVGALGEKVHQEFGAVDILVNNAGVAYYIKSFLDLTDVQVQRLLHINVLSHFWTVRTFLPRMVERKRGHLVSISSVASRLPIRGLTAYCCSKYAVNGLLAGISQEQRRGATGVKTLTVMPACIATDIMPPSLRTSGIHWVDGFPLQVTAASYVADRIILAIKDGSTTITIPGYFAVAFYFLDLLPNWLYDLFADMLKIDTQIEGSGACI